MNCKICGSEIPEESITCPKCGAPVIAEEPAEVDEPVELDDTYLEDEDVLAEEAALEGDTEIAGDGLYGENTEDSDPFDVIVSQDGELEETKKTPSGFKIAAVLIALVLVAAAAVTVFMKTGKSSSVTPHPIIYAKQEDGKNNIYFKGQNSKETLLKTADTQTAQFSQFSDFVAGGKNVYYLDNKTLYLYSDGAASSVKIADNVLANSMVISAQPDTILYVQKAGENSSMDLYKYTKSKKEPEKIETLPLIKQNDQNPTYGFLDNTEDIWYIMIDEGAQASKSGAKNGELFVKTGSTKAKSVTSGVSMLLYGSKNADNLIFTCEEDDNTALKLREKGKDTVLSPKYTNNKPLVVNAPAKGVFFIGDLAEASATSGQSAAGTLYFKKFGGEQSTVDTGVEAALKLGGMTAQVSPYDYGIEAAIKDESIIYKKGDDIVVTKNAKAGTMPDGCNYMKSNPAFSKDGSAVAFLEATGDDSANSTSSATKLMVSKYTNGAWSAPQVVAEKASQFIISSDGSHVAYTVASESDSSQTQSQGVAQLYVYSMKTKQGQQLSDKAFSQFYFEEITNSLIFASDVDQQKQTLTLNYYTSGKPAGVIDTEVGGFTISDTNVPYVVKPTGEGKQNVDLYTISKDMKMQIISQGVQNIFYY